LSHEHPTRLQTRGASGGAAERDFESEGEAVEAPQPRMVGGMCKANWPAQKRPTKREQALES